jgi:hypothetical protein
MALFTRNVLKRMYEYAVARHVATTNPAQALVARFIATQESRTRVLTPGEIGNVLRSIYASDIRRLHKLDLRLLILAMVRKSELIEARKSEFDLDASIWRIPAERMKKDKEHWVYLSAQAVAMLRAIFALTEGRAFLFPTSRGGKDVPIAKSTLNTAVRALNRIVKFSLDSGTWAVLAGSGVSGNQDGPGPNATFTLSGSPDLAIDSGDNLYVRSLDTVRKISPDGTVTTVARQLPTASGAIAVDRSGSIYTAGNWAVQRVSANGDVVSYPFANTSDFITSLTIDNSGNLYAGTRGVGAQIFKLSF